MKITLINKEGEILFSRTTLGNTIRATIIAAIVSGITISKGVVVLL